MPNKKITELPSATVPLGGTEKAEIVQGGVNKQVDVSELGGGTLTNGSGTTANGSAANLGGTLTADAVISTPSFGVRLAGTTTSETRVTIDGINNAAKILSFRTANSRRWALRVDGDETGSNANSDLAFRRYDDTGAAIDAPLTINRSSGISTFTQIPIVGTASPGDNSTQAASTAFVQTAATLDADLTAIGALTPTNDDVIQRKAGAWTNRSIAELKTDLDYGGITGTWVPVWTGFSVDPAGVVAKYTVTGKVCTAMLFCTNGTSNAGPTTVTLPLNADTGAGQFFMIQIVDNNVQTTGSLRTRTTSSPICDITLASGANFTASGNKRAMFTVTYLIE